MPVVDIGIFFINKKEIINVKKKISKVAVKCEKGRRLFGIMAIAKT